MAGGDGISAQTKNRLVQDAGFNQADFSDTDGPVGAVANTLQMRSQGKTYQPQTMSPADAAALQAKQNAAAEANRTQSMQRNAASRKALPAQTWSPDN